MTNARDDTIPASSGDEIQDPDQGESPISQIGDGHGIASSSGPEQAGDEERLRQSEEIHDARLAALKTYGRHASQVIIIGGEIDIGGSVVGGNAPLGQEGATALLSEVPASVLASLDEVFVPPGGYDTWAADACNERVCLLRSPPRWGSSMTAFHLLSSQHTIHEVEFAGPLNTLPVDRLPEGCGFVLEWPSSAQLQGLRERDLSALGERLALRDAWLVVIIDPDVRLSDPWLAGSTHGLSGPPSIEALVASHLAYQTGDPAIAEAFLTANGVAERIRAIGSDAVDVYQLVELARDLAAASRGEHTVSEILERYEARRQSDVEEWLDQIPEFGQRSLVVALAALDGMTYDAISRAATMLECAWREEDGQGSPVPRTRLSRRTRLKAARARISRQLLRTRYGSAELDVATFASDDYPMRVLDHLWTEHDYDREVVLAWLRAVAEDPEGRVRIRAASAIGFFSRLAFDTIRRDVVTPWAGSGNGDERERAVAALAVPARYPDTAPRVVRLVQDWCARDSLALRMTAARALGSSVGALLPGGPDERLADLAKGANYGLAVALGQSIAELMGGAEPDRKLTLLHMLSDWSREGQAGRQRAGIIGFLEVAASRWTTAATSDGDMLWPDLLRMAVGDGALQMETRNVLTTMWQRSLIAPGADRSVHNVLRAWAGAAKKEPGLQVAMVGLLVDVATTQRTADLLAHHAKSWRHQVPLAPDLADNLLAALSRREVRLGS